MGTKLSDKEKELIVGYAEHDGEVTLTLDEVGKLFYELECLEEELNRIKFDREYYNKFTEVSDNLKEKIITEIDREIKYTFGWSDIDNHLARTRRGGLTIAREIVEKAFNNGFH